MDDPPASWAAAVLAAALPLLVVLDFSNLEHVLGNRLGHDGGPAPLLAVVGVFGLAWIPGIPILARCAQPAKGGVVAGAYVAAVMALALLPLFSEAGPLLLLPWVLFASLAVAAGATAGGVAAWTVGGAGGGMPAVAGAVVLALALSFFVPTRSPAVWAWMVPLGLGVLGLVLWRRRWAGPPA